MAADWIEQFENRADYREAMARLVAMHRLIGEKRRSVSASNYKLKIFLLCASALTTGALWVLLAGTFQEPMKWVGAGLSTVVTGLNALQVTVGPGKVVEQLDDLYSEFGRSLAHARENSNNFSWHNFKHLEGSYLRHGVPLPTAEQVQSARLNGMM